MRGTRAATAKRAGQTTEGTTGQRLERLSAGCAPSQSSCQIIESPIIHGCSPLIVEALTGS